MSWKVTDVVCPHCGSTQECLAEVKDGQQLVVDELCLECQAPLLEATPVIGVSKVSKRHSSWQVS